MTKHQMASLTMYKTVLALCEENSTIVAVIAAFAADVQILTDNVAAIDEAVGIEEENTKGITVAKRKLKGDVSTAAANIAAGVYAFAAANGDDELMAKVDYAPSELQRMIEYRLASVATVIHKLANDHKSDVAPFGIDAQTINTFADTIKEYKTAVPSTRIALVRKITAGQSIDTLIPSTNDLLKKRMDKTARQLKKDYPDFYSEYRNARKLVKPGVTHTSIKGTAVNKADGTPVYQAFIEIEELELTVYSNLVGEFESGKIKHGIYNIKIGAPGCQTQVLHNVQVKFGKVTHLAIELAAQQGEMTEAA